MSKKVMSKKGRKRSNNGVKAVKVNFDNLRPINQVEANMFQELVQISNAFAKLKQQKAMYEMKIKSLKDRRKDIQSGKITLPIMLPLGENKFYNCSDMKYALQELDSEISIISNALKGISGQMIQNFDAYVEAGLRIHDFTNRKFTQYKPKNTFSSGCSPKEEERILFEGELDKLAESTELQEEFKKASKKAVKANKK